VYIKLIVNHDSKASDAGDFQVVALFIDNSQVSLRGLL